MNIAELVRPHLKTVKPYSSARDEYTGAEGVFLDANENPYGSAAGAGWNRYPDPYQRPLKQEIARIKKVAESSIFLGNGSDEPIDLLIRAFCEPGKDHILTFPPTYGMYQVSAGIQNVEVERVLLSSDFQLDLEPTLAALECQPKITFLCSPNNPSGNLLNRSEMQQVLEKASGIVVVDEAYIDFPQEESWNQVLDQYPNLVVLQTFSKAWGMASLRLGMAFASEEIVQLLNKIKPPYNIPGPVQEVALEALQSNEDKMKSWVKGLNRERDQLISRVEALPMVQKVFPSDANFLLVRFDQAKEVFHYLLEQKVIVRDRSSQPLCEGCLRLTVGTSEENDRLIEQLIAFRK
ncbi:MAG: histidinol-phosphate transaminase [Cytophagales bacterium]|nr:histidinol-phosphate transaminase [Cytophagales bacterium]